MDAVEVPAVQPVHPDPLVYDLPQTREEGNTEAMTTNAMNPVLKKCVRCGAKIDLAERMLRERNLPTKEHSRHDYCKKCQNTP